MSGLGVKKHVSIICIIYRERQTDNKKEGEKRGETERANLQAQNISHTHLISVHAKLHKNPKYLNYFEAYHNIRAHCNN